MIGIQESFKIENRRFEKYIRLFKILAILAGVLAIIRVLLNPKLISGTGSLLDFGIMLLPILLFFEYRRKTKNWGGQFIEVSRDQLSFKTRSSEKTTIPLSEITKIEIKLDHIILQSADSVEHTIDLEDFTDYSDRTAIKNNFEMLRNRV